MAPMRLRAMASSPLNAARLSSIWAYTLISLAALGIWSQRQHVRVGRSLCGYLVLYSSMGGTHHTPAWFCLIFKCARCCSMGARYGPPSYCSSLWELRFRRCAPFWYSNMLACAACSHYLSVHTIICFLLYQVEYLCRLPC